MKDAGKDDLEALSEDALGFSLRSLKTLRDFVVRPAAVMQAYASGDRQSYTPALRIWLGLLGLQFLIALFTGGFEDAVLNQVDDDETAREMFASLGIEPAAFARRFADVMSVVHTPIGGLITALTVFLLGLYNRDLSRAARFNIAFTILSVGSLVALVELAIVGPHPHPALILLIGAGYFVTFYRGGQGLLARTRAGAVGRGLLHSAVTLALMMFAGLVSGTVATIIAFATLSG